MKYIVRGITAAALFALSAAGHAQTATATLVSVEITPLASNIESAVPPSSGSATGTLSGNTLTLDYTMDLGLTGTLAGDTGDSYALTGSFVIDFTGPSGTHSLTDCVRTDVAPVGLNRCSLLGGTTFAAVTGTPTSFTTSLVMNAGNTLVAEWSVSYPAAPPPAAPPAASPAEPVPALPLVGLVLLVVGLGGAGLAGVKRKR